MTLAIATPRTSGSFSISSASGKAPFRPSSVVEEFAGVLKQFGLSTVRGDRYAGEWPAEIFVHGVSYQVSDLNRSEIYLATLPLLNSGRVVARQQRMAAQFLGLERRTSRAGKDTVNHSPGGHDDVANAVAGALVLALENAGHSFEAWSCVFAGNGEPEVADVPDPLPWRPSKRERAYRDGTIDGGNNPTIPATYWVTRKRYDNGAAFIRPPAESVCRACGLSIAFGERKSERRKIRLASTLRPGGIAAMTIGEFFDIDLVVHGMDDNWRLFLSTGRPGYAPVEVDIYELAEHEFAREFGISPQVIVKVLGMLSGLAHRDRLCGACASRATN